MKGKISISRYMNSRNMPEPITITIDDESSGTMLLHVSMSLENFALIMTGMSFVDCNYELGAIKHAGKIREYKTEYVMLPHDWYRLTKEELMGYAAEHEIDGWMLHNPGDLGNHHRLVKGTFGTYEVGYVRFVDPKE